MIRRILLRSSSIKIALPALAMVAFCTGCDSQKPTYDKQEKPPTTVDERQVNPDRPPTPETLYAMARLLVAQGKVPEARFILEKTTRDYPRFMPAYVKLAEMEMDRNDPEAARRVLLRALQQKPNDCVVLNDVGMTYVLQKNYLEASRNFEKAVAGCPQERKYRANLAMALGMQGRYEESMALYKKVLPEEDAHYNMAVIAASLNDKTTAQREFAAARRYATTAPTVTTMPCR